MTHLIQTLQCPYIVLAGFDCTFNKTLSKNWDIFDFDEAPLTAWVTYVPSLNFKYSCFMF